jgi:hypothetical protein
MNFSQTRAMAIASRVLLILGGISLAVGVLAGTLNKNFLNGPTLIKHVENIRMDPQVTDALTDTLTNKIVSQAPRLEPARPIIHSVANTVVTSDALRPVIKNLLRQVHTALVTGKQLQVEYGEVATNLVTTVNKFFPDANIPTVTEMKAQIPTDGAIGAIMKIQIILKAANTLGTYLPVAAIIFFILFVALSTNRNKAVGRIGIAVFSAGFSLAVFTALLWFGVLFVGRDPGVAPYSTAMWNEFLPTFITPAVLLMFAGAIWTAVLGGILPNLDVISMIKQTWAKLWSRPTTALGTTGRGLLILGAGIFVIQQPLAAVKAVVLVGAVLLILIGVFELNRLIERKGESAAETTDPAAKWIVPGLAVATLVGIIGYLMLNATASSTEAHDASSIVVIHSA